MAKELKPKKPSVWEARRLRAATPIPIRRPVFGKRGVEKPPTKG